MATSAALFVTGQTAYHALVTMGKIVPGDTVLITAAAGGVGTCAVQIAKSLGAKVIAAAGLKEKCALATSLGADLVVNYRESAWSERVLQATDGQGASLIIESVGGDVGSACQRCWAPGGRMVIFGKASGNPTIVSGDDLLFGNRTVYGLAVGTVIEDEIVMREAMDRLIKWVDQERLRSHIGGVYPLRDAAEAHRDLESRKTTGKLVLMP